MAKVLGIGGVFFKSPDPARLRAWYSQRLGFAADEYGAMFAPATMPQGGMTVWNPFAATTDYFAPSQASFMINLVVDDLDGALAQVREGGAEVVGSENHDYGRFGWFVDPDGNKVELWQPPAPAQTSA
jgi:predicted enzyme related to lactoylglutathione lyase